MGIVVIPQTKTIQSLEDLEKLTQGDVVDVDEEIRGMYVEKAVYEGKFTKEDYIFLFRHPNMKRTIIGILVNKKQISIQNGCASFLGEKKALVIPIAIYTELGDVRQYEEKDTILRGGGL